MQAVAVVVASCVTVYGISSWRREAIGQRRIELAENVLARFYEVRDVVRAIRSPFAGGSEGKSRVRAEGETPSESSARDNAYVVFERYERNRDVFNDLQSLRYRFMAQHGRPAGEPFEDVNRTLNRIFFAANSLSELWQRQGGHFRDDKAFQDHLDRMQQNEAIFWHMADDDEINSAIAEAIRDIEGICNPLIEQATKDERGVLARIRGMFSG